MAILDSHAFKAALPLSARRQNAQRPLRNILSAGNSGGLCRGVTGADPTHNLRELHVSPGQFAEMATVAERFEPQFAVAAHGAPPSRSGSRAGVDRIRNRVT